MRLKIGAAIFLLCLLHFVLPAPVKAQVMTVGPDSVLVPIADTANTKKQFFFSDWDKPAKAALFSAVLPGLGQIYNRAYWKVPLVWATGGVLGYFLIDNNRNYQDFRKALITRNSGGIDKFANHPAYGTSYQYGTQNVRYARDQYRRWRDMTILISLGAWGLNVAEAYVHAHMKDFDVGEELSMRIQPNIINTPYAPGVVTPGISLTLYTK